MTLGCGGFGGNITSDNITPRHLLNIKRLAYEVRPVNASAIASRSRRCSRQATVAAAPGAAAAAGGAGQRRVAVAPDRPIPAVPRVSAARPSVMTPRRRSGPVRHRGDSARRPRSSCAKTTSACAARANRKILIDERTIVTPAARDAGEALRIFEHASWRP